MFHVAASDSAIIVSSDCGKLYLLNGEESGVIRTRNDVTGGFGWGFGSNGGKFTILQFVEL